MAGENKLLVISAPAIEDLSNDQYRFVVLASTGVRRPDTEAEVAFGILQNAPVEGEPAAVMVYGISKLQANDALGVGDFVMQEYVSAADAGKGKTSIGAPAYTRAVVVEAAAAEDDLCSVLLTGTFPAINDAVAHVTTVTTDTTAGANTWSAAELIGGLMLRDPNGASRSDVTPTAAAIVGAIAGAIVGSSFEFTIRNTADAAETITLTPGAGVTLSGLMTIRQGCSRRFLAVCTNVTGAAEAVTIYDINDSEPIGSRSAVATVNTADAVTFSAAQILGGLILRDPNGGARADLLAAAEDIVAAIPGCIVGSSFEFTIRNTADAAETITVTTNTRLTLSGTMTIAQNNSKRFLAVVTNAGAGTEAVSVYSLGTVVH